MTSDDRVAAAPPTDVEGQVAAVAPHLARSLRRAGLCLAAALLVGAVVGGAAVDGERPGLLWATVFAVSGLALVGLGGALLDWVFLGGGAGRMGVELRRGNVAAGMVSAGHHVAVGLMLDRCFYGRSARDLLIAGAFLAIALFTLMLLLQLYRALTRYDDAAEIRDGNHAAAFAYLGLTVGLALIVGHAAEGDFLGWGASLRAYGWALLLAVALYPVRQLVIGGLLLGLRPASRGGALDHLIGQGRQDVAGAIEGVAYVAAAVLATGIG